MKYAVKFTLDTDRFTNWDDDQIEDNDYDEYVESLRRIMRRWQPEMFTKYGLNKKASQQ